MSYGKKPRTVLFYGTFIHPNEQHTDIQILPKTALVVKDGRITCIESAETHELEQIQQSHSAETVVTFPPQGFVIPGFVDAHIHASQYPNAGLALDKPLLEWLHEYTYPTEARFSNQDVAESVYHKVVSRTLLSGTTMASYFATIDVRSTLALCDVAERLGQKAYVGKVSMDMNSPDYYSETTSDAIANARSFVEQALARKYTTVTPCVTPRFAISCTKELMLALGKLADEYSLPIQTHLSESISEIEQVKKLFDVKSYLGLYRDCGLVTENTVFAHCVYSTGEEMEIMEEANCGVAHCPTSNTNILSGFFPARKFLDKGLRVGLGTDVSGGHIPSILQVIQRAIDVSKVLQIQNGGAGASPKHLGVNEAFCLATIGGAKALNQEKNMGSFEVGKCFDALYVDPYGEGSPIDVFHEFPSSDRLEDTFQKFIMLGDDRNIVKVYINGICIKDKLSNATQSTLSGC